MPNSTEKLKSNVWVMCAVAAFLISIGTIVVKQTTTSVIAEQNLEFVKKNRNLPQKVFFLEKDMERVKEAIKSVPAMQNEQRHIIEDMRKIQENFEKAVDRINGHPKEKVRG